MENKEGISRYYYISKLSELLIPSSVNYIHNLWVRTYKEYKYINYLDYLQKGKIRVQAPNPAQSWHREY